MLDYREFVAASLHMQSIDNDEYSRKVFQYFDKDGSGYIEIEEFRKALADGFGPNDVDVVNRVLMRWMQTRMAVLVTRSLRL